MYNWRLLLLAFFAVFQPIASYTERNLVDGRQQCCDHRLSRDSTYSLYGDSHFKSESRRINDQRRDIREVRNERQNENIPAPTPAIDIFRDSYREREVRQSPELRARYSRTELHRERESRVEVRNGSPEERERNFRVISRITDRIRSAENRRDNRVIRTDDKIIFRTRNDNQNLDQRNQERRTIDTRREIRLMRDNVNEVRRIRDIRDTREEFRRPRDNIIRTDTLRTLNNQRIQQDEPLDRQESSIRLVTRNQRSVRSLDISRGSNDNRRLSFENFRVAKQERENRDGRALTRDEVRNEAERRNIEIVRQRSDIHREIGSRFSTTRQTVLRNQRSVRSLDRLSRGTNDKKLYFENVRNAQQERENHDVRARDRDYDRTEAERRSNEKSVREQLEVDRKTNSRFLTTRQTDLRNQRSVNDDRRLSYGNYRTAKQERENRDMRVRLSRDEVRNAAELRNIEILVRESSEHDREIDSHLSATRQAVVRNQRSVRSLDRLSRVSNDKRLSSGNVRIAQQERENRDVRARKRDDVRPEAEQRNIENLVRERSVDDREIESRFSATRQAILRNQRIVRSLDRHSTRSDNRRISFRNVRMAHHERENRDVRDRIEAERSNIENRVNQRPEVDREIGSRFTLSRQANNNRERRSSIDSTRRNNELRTSTNSGDRANQINRERKNDYRYRSDQHVSRYVYDRSSFDSQYAAISRKEAARTRVDERMTNEMRIREDMRKINRHDIRGVSLKNRRAREVVQWRLSRSESRLFENSREYPSYSREREFNEYRRTVDDRVHERMQDQSLQLREISRNIERENALRPQIRNRDEREQRDKNRASRGRSIERRSVRERVSSEPRDSREVHRRVTEIRNFRFMDNESRFRATSESKLSSRIIEREIRNTRDNLRNFERGNTRDVDERRDFTRNVIVSKTTERQNIDIRTKSNVNFGTDHINTISHKRAENENTAYENNWQNLIYTMQGIYLCSIFIPMLMSKNSDKKRAKTLGLWTSIQKLIKTD